MGHLLELRRHGLEVRLLGSKLHYHLEVFANRRDVRECSRISDIGQVEAQRDGDVRVGGKITVNLDTKTQGGPLHQPDVGQMFAFNENLVGMDGDVIGDDEFFAYPVNDERQSETKTIG